MFTPGFLILLALAPLTSERDVSVDELLRKAGIETQKALAAREDPTQGRSHFRSAAHLYEDAYQNGHRNAACLRNEGNAALLGGDLPLAILAYRRGLRLEPNDTVMRSHLAFARDQVDYPGSGQLGRPPASSWPSGLPRPQPGWVLGPAGVSYALACLALTRWWMMRKARFLFTALILGSVAILFGIGLFWMSRQDQDETQHPIAVISENGVLLRAGNGLAYPPRYETPLNRGVEARMLFKRGRWIQIELAGGEAGWVNQDYLLIDEP